MGKGYNNYMCKKPFHPGSKANIKRAWMAEQKTENEKRKQEDLKQQYDKEQDLYTNRAMISTESKDKLELNFMYEAPPGAKREHQKEDDEPEYKFEWQRKYNAPREDYAKGNEDITDQPFGIAVRNVRCIKCHKWGHINTDRECPLFSQASTSAMPTTSMDPMELMRQMREDGYGLKENVLGHRMNPGASNQQFISSEESDPEADFLNSLSLEDKKKLLRKLKKLSKKHEKMKRKKMKKKAKSKHDSSSESDNDKKKKSQEASDSDDELSEKEHSRHKKERKKLKHANKEYAELNNNAKEKRKKQSQKHDNFYSGSDDRASRKRDKHKYDESPQHRSRSSSSSISEDGRSKYQSKKMKRNQHSSSKKLKYSDVVSKDSAKYKKRSYDSSDSEDDRSEPRSKIRKASKSHSSKKRYDKADSDDSDLKVSTKEISNSKKSKSYTNSTKFSQSKSSKWYSSDDSEIDQTYSSRASKSNVHSIKKEFDEENSFKNLKRKFNVSLNTARHDKGKEMHKIEKPKEQIKQVANFPTPPKVDQDNNALNVNVKDDKKSLKTKPIKSEKISEIDLNSDQSMEKSVSNVDMCVQNVDESSLSSHNHPDGFSHLDPLAENVKNRIKQEFGYNSEKDDKFRQKYRDNRSPSVKQKYNTRN